MKRRHFITLAGAGAIGTTALRSTPITTAKSTRWQPDGAGLRARIGVLTPEFDPVPESEMWAMVPQGVSVHAARVRRNREARGFAEPPNIDNATEQLTGLALRAIVYAYTSSSYALGAEADELLKTRLEKLAGGIPLVLTCPAATEALRILGANRVAVIHPPWFTEEINNKGMEYFRSRGFDVVLCTRITPSRQFTEVSPEEVYEWVMTNVPRQAEAVFIGGNGLRAVGVIQALEKSLRRPVLTANQVVLWGALRVGAGVTSKVTRYGRVFTKSGANR